MDRIELRRLFGFINGSYVMTDLREKYEVRIKPSKIGEFMIAVYASKEASRSLSMDHELAGEGGFIQRLNKELRDYMNNYLAHRVHVEIEPNPKFDDMVTIYVFSEVPEGNKIPSA